MVAEAAAETIPAEDLESLPPSAAEPEADVLDWLEEPAVEAAPVEPLAEFGFDDEPMVAEAAAETVPAEEIDSLPLPAADPDDDVSDWLEEPEAEAAPVEPLADLGFDDEPMALEAAPEAAPAEEVGSLPPQTADPDDEVSDWLEEPEAEAAPAEPLAELGFDDEPMALEVASEDAPAKELDKPPPAAEEEADVFGWLEEPLTSDTQAEAELPGDIEFGEEAIAAEPIVGSDEPEELAPLAPPAAASNDDFMNWLEEPEPRTAQRGRIAGKHELRRGTGRGGAGGRPWHG